MKNKNNQHIANLLQSGIRLQASGKYLKSIEAYEKALTIDKANHIARLNIGSCKFMLGRYTEAAEILHKLHEDKPDDINLLKLCAATYSRLGQPQLSIKFIKRAINFQPDDYEAWLDLTKYADASLLHKDAIQYAAQAVSLKPTDTRSHTNLGACFNTMERLSDALFCFETALKIDPVNVLALSNIAIIHDKRGDSELAIEYLTRALALVEKGSQNEVELFYKMSYPLLYSGNLKKGWEMYEYGFKPHHPLSRSPKRIFNSPQWTGEDISNKKILVWREQGLGDEIMFFSILPDLLKECSSVTIECDSRLVSLLQRSFPNCQVREQQYKQLSGISDKDDFDFHLPVGSLMKHYRNNIEDFQRGNPYFIPDENLKSEFSSRLSKLRSKKLIGICWRSGMISAERNLNYTAISEWAEIFKIQGVEFINLQYGDCENELRLAEQEFNIKIHRWEDVDLKNDIEKVVALVSQLDCVISAGTAVAQITGATGTHLKIFTPKNWTLLGTNQYPWIPNSQLFTVEYGKPISDTLPLIAHEIKSNFLHQ